MDGDVIPAPIAEARSVPRAPVDGERMCIYMLKKLIALLLALALAALPVLAEDGASLMKRANEYLSAGDAARALACCRLAERVEPDKPKAYLMEAVLRLSRGEGKAARDCADAVLAFDPLNANAWLMRCRADAALKDLAAFDEDRLFAEVCGADLNAAAAEFARLLKGAGRDQDAKAYYSGSALDVLDWMNYLFGDAGYGDVYGPGGPSSGDADGPATSGDAASAAGSGAHASSGHAGDPSFSGYSGDLLQQLLGGGWYSSQTGTGSTGTPAAPSGYGGDAGTLNRKVAKGSRAKYTRIRGKGRDVFTVMVYMCGSDLESRNAMGTKDLQEMLYAEYGDDVRVIVFTGGSRQWQNRYVSPSVNQVWQVKDGQLKCLVENAGNTSMTSPATLSAFICYCAGNFSANRYGLILWDHGSGSVSGYGYDEKNARSGAMSLAGLNTALTDGGVKFDFIGFDACLMGTLENALMCSKHADYLIASEESEPGIGWYYTKWLTELGKDTSLPTLDIGRRICDDFVSQCNRQCRGQQTTLSLVDLAELEHTVPGKFTSFSQSISTMVANREYKTVSNARSGAREFAQSTRIDQVDLTDLCDRMGTTQSKALSKVLRSAVKYNRTGNISNAYGLSVYFPYKNLSNVDQAVSAYNAIGMDDAYAKAISDFASVEAAGQGITGGTGSALPSLFGLSGGYGGAGSGYSGGSVSDDMIGGLLSQFLGGGYGDIYGLNGGNTGFLSWRSVSDEDMVQILSDNLLDPSQLEFGQKGGDWVLSLGPEQWALVSGVDQNLFYDNGEGYVDMGLDNLFSFNSDGQLVADMDATWLAINGQPAPYYHETTDYFSDDEWRVTGRVPALLNGERVDLLVMFDAEHEYGYISGARQVYDEKVTRVVAKSLLPLKDGDRISLLVDLYDYDQNYIDSYEFGEPITVNGDPVVSSVYLPDPARCMVTYRITDIYNQAYWTPVIGGR